MIINHNRKFIFVAIPKTASLSIHYTLGYKERFGEPDYYHASIDQILFNNSICKDYFKFAFVRNPWERIYSLYCDFIYRRHYQYSEKVIFEKKLFYEFANFNDFCIRFKDTIWSDNVFLRPQVSFIDIDGVNRIDFIGRFENIHNHFNDIRDILGLPNDVELIKINNGKYRESYKDCFNQDAKNAVANFYKDDIERFEYTYV